MATERRKGDRTTGIPVDDWNEFCRTSKRVDQLVKNPVIPGQQSADAALTILVINKTDAAIDADFPILKISPLFTTEDRDTAFYDGIVFKGETPDTDTAIEDIAILQRPTTDGGACAGVITGYTWCDVEVTDESHTHAAPSDGENTKLTSGSSGAAIAWKESGTGTKKAIVRMGGGGSGGSTNLFRVKITVDVSPRSDWTLAGAGTGKAVTVNDDGSFGGEFDVLSHYADTLPADNPAWAMNDGSNTWIVNVGCSAGPSE